MVTTDEKQPLDQETTNEVSDKIEISKDEYERLENESKSWKESTKEAQRLSAVAEVVKDNSKFLKLYQTDKAKAEFVASHRGKTASELNEQLTEYYNNHPEEKTAPSEEDIMAKREMKQQEKDSKKILNSFIKEKWIEKTSKLGKEFLAEVEDYMDWKVRKESTIEKAISKAFTIVKWLPEFQQAYNRTQSQLQWAWSMQARATRPSSSEWQTSAYEQWKSNRFSSIQDYVNKKWKQ